MDICRFLTDEAVDVWLNRTEDIRLWLGQQVRGETIDAMGPTCSSEYRRVIGKDSWLGGVLQILPSQLSLGAVPW